MKIAEVTSRYPSMTDHGYASAIRRILRDGNAKIAVLDDDPTGIQTVHDCPLLTSWTESSVLKALQSSATVFYVLTNSRSLGESDAVARQSEALNAIIDGNEKVGKTLHVVSRSDSTLRGHFPAEPDAIMKTLAARSQPVATPPLFIPAFFEAGRHTVDDTHYVASGDDLIPAGDTEFAKDSVFGYASSNLRDYIAEKSKGRIGTHQIASITLSYLREDSVERLAGRIGEYADKRYLIGNVFDYVDLRKLCTAALIHGLSKRSSLVVRSSSSLVKALAGLDDRDLLRREELLLLPRAGVGLIIVGSHVQKTTRQLKHLLSANEGVAGIEINVGDFMGNAKPSLSTVSSLVADAANQGRTPVVYTSREEIQMAAQSERLKLGKAVSRFLVDLVARLSWQPTYMITKGGITSHDILAEGLDVSTATVKGQIMPGVPAIVMSEDHRWAGMPLVIFPGNVGDDDTLTAVFRKLRSQEKK